MKIYCLPPPRPARTCTSKAGFAVRSRINAHMWIPERRKRIQKDYFLFSNRHFRKTFADCSQRWLIVPIARLRDGFSNFYIPLIDYRCLQNPGIDSEKKCKFIHSVIKKAVEIEQPHNKSAKKSTHNIYGQLLTTGEWFHDV